MPLKIIVVGAGRAGKELHIDAFNAQPDTKVIAVCDPDETRARAASLEKNIPYFYISLGEALKNHKADVISICSPPQFHLEHAIQAMDTGAHVLLEKPMVTTIREANDLRSHQVQAGVKLCLVHNFKFSHGIKEALAIVNRGDIGNVLHVERTWLRNGTMDRMISNPDFWCHRLPGGRWTETLPHDIYVPYQFLGALELVSVQARKLHERWPWLPADEVSVTLQSRKGYLTIRYSANVDDELYNYTVVHGSKGVLITDGGFLAKLPLHSPSAKQQFFSGGKAIVRAGLDRMLRLAKNVPKSSRRETQADGLGLARQSSHYALIEQFIRHVREDADPPVSWDEAYMTMTLVEQIGLAIQSEVEK